MSHSPVNPRTASHVLMTRYQRHRPYTLQHYHLGAGVLMEYPFVVPDPCDTSTLISNSNSPVSGTWTTVA